MPSRRVYALTSLVLLMIVWGSTFVVTKAATREILGVLIGVVFFGEALSPWQLLGGGVALAGMWLASSNAPAPRASEQGAIH